MLKNIFVLLCIVVTSELVKSQEPDWQWARYATGAGTQETFQSATDPSGNVYLAGNFQNDITFGSTTVTQTGLGMFVAKFTSAGNLIWLRSSGGIGSNGVYLCASDIDGNVYITGRYANSITFGPYTLTNLQPTVYHIFITKYDSSGNVCWARSAGESGNDPDMAWAVHIDKSSNVYIAGNVQTDTIPLDSDTLFSKGGSACLIKYDSSGTELWSRNAPCNYFAMPQYIASDSNANLYVAGYWNGDSLNFPGTTLFNNGPPAMHEIFICSYDSSGNFRWAKSYGGAEMDNGYGVACDNANNVYFTGNFKSSPITFDSYTIPNTSGQYNYFIAKYDPSGNMIWLKNDSGQSGGYCIISDVQNNLYWSGNFYSVDVLIDTITLQRPAVYSDPVFIAKLDTSGKVFWAKELASGGDDNNGLSLGNNGDIFFSGDFYDVSPFIIGEDSLILSGLENAFIAKLGYNTVTALFNTPDNSICPGTCTNFNNTSVNATSYLWYFPGSSSLSSTDINPANICYTTPGQYNVTLIAAGPNGIDTLILPNYITVLPLPPPQGILQNGDTLFSNQGAVTYQWYLNNTSIPGGTNYFYVAQQSGNYSVIAIDANGCEVEAVLNNVVAGIEMAKSNWQLSTYPNPVTEKLYVKCYKPALPRGAVVGLFGSAVEITVYNLLGEKQFLPFNSGQQTLDCRQLRGGLYFLEINSGEKIFRTTFSVVH
jgi:hypothetical protein